MPLMVSSTAAAPFWAASRERRATWADCSASSEAALMELAMLWAVSPARRSSWAWRSVAESSSSEVRWADSVAVVTRMEASLMRRTSTESSSMV